MAALRWRGGENEDEPLTVVTRGSGVSRPRAVAGEGAPRLGAAGAVLAQVREASEEETTTGIRF